MVKHKVQHIGLCGAFVWTLTLCLATDVAGRVSMHTVTRYGLGAVAGVLAVAAAI